MSFRRILAGADESAFTRSRTGLHASSDAQARLAQIGANEVPERRERPLARFARKFWGLSVWMLELIVFLSLIRPKMETCPICWRLTLERVILGCSL